MPPVPVHHPYRHLAFYFAPIALQAASQSLTYPLVATVASRGPGGPLDYAGLVQSNSLMFLVGTLGYGLVTAGMVFGRTRAGFKRFVWFNHAVMLVGALVQAVLCLPAVSHAVFARLLGLPPTIESPAAEAFPLTILLNALFYLRNPYQVILFNHGAAGRSSLATFVRIGATLAMAPLFCHVGWVGPRAAMACQSVAVGLECLVSWYFARPLRDSFDGGDGIPPTRREILSFNVPLAMGGFFMTLGGWLLGGLLARAGEPERVLPVFYLAIGLANPAAYAASQLKAVVIHFRAKGVEDVVMFRFVAMAAAFVALVPLVFLLPGINQWYYVTLQRLPETDLPLVAVTAFLLVTFPISIGFRAHREGLAASLRRTSTILAGNLTHIATLMVAGWSLLAMNVPGYVLAPVAMLASNATTTAMLRYLLRDSNPPEPPPTGPAPGVEG